MRLGSFLKLVEIRTKIASLTPFLIGTLYALYHFRRFNGLNFVIMFASMLAFDMVTTALNNYFDYKQASKKHGYNYETHNAIVRDHLSETKVLSAIAVLLLSAVVLGIILVVRTNIIVLAIGAASFAVGICYSFGPIPISRTPLGELLSGFFMGFVILFLSVYIHIYDLGIISLAYQNGFFTLRLQVIEILYIFLLSIPTICCIANIMLANNICDMEDDIENRRFTLPIYVGKKNALLLFSGLYYAVYVDLLILAILGLVPLACLLVLVTLIPVHKNIRTFHAKQTKKETFALSVQNFVLTCGVEIILFAAAYGVGKILQASV